MQVTDFKTADNYWSTNEHLFIMHVFSYIVYILVTPTIKFNDA